MSQAFDEFTKSLQVVLDTRQIKCFNTEEQKMSEEVNKKFKSWKGKPSMIWKSIQSFHSVEHYKFKLKDLQFQVEMCKVDG